MLRDSASWISIGLAAVAMLLSVGACLGDSEPTDMGLAISPVYRSPTSTPIPTPAVVQHLTTRPPCPAESGWMTVKGIVICLPTGATLSVLIDHGPMFHIIKRGNSEVRIDVDTGEIVKWDVPPEDEEEFRRLILEPLEEAGY